MQIAYNAHHNQVDKSGIPYIFHPAHLAEQMHTEAETVVALLHDVVEDSLITFDYLIAEGFSDEIIDALRLLTHNSSVPYLDYVEQIKCNPIARTVKIADLRHNSDMSRLNIVDEKVKERLSKYCKALDVLTDVGDCELP